MFYSELPPAWPRQPGVRAMRTVTGVLCAVAFIMAAVAGCMSVALMQSRSSADLRSLRNSAGKHATPAKVIASEEGPTDCNESHWAGSGQVCGDCRVLVERFQPHNTTTKEVRKLSASSASGTCQHYCSAVGHKCRRAWQAAERGSCAAVWEVELSCEVELLGNQAICFCGEKLPKPNKTEHPEHHIARAVHHRHKNHTEEHHKIEHYKQLLAKVHFPKPPPCNQFEVDTDFWTKAMLWTVPHVTSVEKCNEHCNLEPRCGAWTWGKKRDVPGLSDVCFLKVVADDGTFKRDNKTGVVSGVRSEQRLCTASEMAEFLLETAEAKQAEAEANKAKADAEKAEETLAHANHSKDQKSHGSNESKSDVEEKKKAHDEHADEKDAADSEEDDKDADEDDDDKDGADPKPKPVGNGEEFEKGTVRGVVKSKGGHCLTAPERANLTGRVQMWTCNEEDLSQKWTFDGRTGQLRNHFGLCLAAPARTTEFTKLEMRRCDTERWDQQWDYFRDTSVLKNWEGICVDAAESNIDGGMVYMRACHPENRNQQWLIGQLDELPSTDDEGMHPSGTSLFCFALMIPHIYEQELLTMQYKHKVSLFQCEGYAVYSNMSIPLADGLTTRPIDSDLHCEKGGEFGTALNLPIFEALWARLVADKTYLQYDWSVKVDPDAVFFAARLRRAVGVHMETEKGVYLNNCKYGLHGPIEVFSRNAVTTWWEGRERCHDYFWKLCNGDCFWGEDLYIDQCLWKVLDVRRNNDYRLLVEDHCDPPKDWDNCEDSSHVSFHPFKTVKSYMKCMHTASQQAPLPMK